MKRRNFLGALAALVGAGRFPVAATESCPTIVPPQPVFLTDAELAEFARSLELNLRYDVLGCAFILPDGSLVPESDAYCRMTLTSSGPGYTSPPAVRFTGDDRP
jgi:hypothetical protein